MGKKGKIKELEIRQTELKDNFRKLILQPISDESISEVETTGVDIITESIHNDIMLDILNWDDNDKLSKSALKFKKLKTKN